MLKFTRDFVVHAPLERVAEFHKDTRALKWLNPPPILVQFQHVEPLAEGSIAEFTLWLGPLPIRWKARHDNVDPERGFSDLQVTGPFQYWKHRHDFTPIDNFSTRVTDTIQADHGSHLFWGLLSRFMWLNLPLLFTYRAWQTRRHCETK